MSEITYIFLLPNKDNQHFTNVPPSLILTMVCFNI